MGTNEMMSFLLNTRKMHYHLFYIIS